MNSSLCMQVHMKKNPIIWNKNRDDKERVISSIYVQRVLINLRGNIYHDQ